MTDGAQAMTPTIEDFAKKVSDPRSCLHQQLTGIAQHSHTALLSICSRTARCRAVAAVQGKVVAAVCHGPAALTEAKVNGEYLVKGKHVRTAILSSEIVALNASFALLHQMQQLAGKAF